MSGRVCETLVDGFVVQVSSKLQPFLMKFDRVW